MAVYGAAALSQALDNIDFPKTRDELLAEVGDKVIEIEKGKETTVRDILRDCSHDTYNNVIDVVTCEEVKQNLRAA